MRRLCRWPTSWSIATPVIDKKCPYPQFFQRAQRRGVRQRPSRPRPLNDIVVREYEQSSNDPKDRIRVDDYAELEETGEILKAKIDNLEKELAVLKEGPFGPNSEFMQSLSPEAREKALKALQDAKDRGELDEDEEIDMFSDEELDRMADGIEQGDDEGDVKIDAPKVTLEIPRVDQSLVGQFNKALSNVTAPDSNADHNFDLWKWYLRCKKQVQNFTKLVPEDAWQIIWQSQEGVGAGSKHLVVLARDMLAVDTPLSAEQWITYIGCLRLNDAKSTAIDLWEQKRDLLGRNEELASAFWSLGVHLYSDLNRPSKAHDIAVMCIEHGTISSPEILVPVIVAWAQSHDPEAATRAWATYLRLRALRGPEMTFVDFDRISTALLKADKADLALAVFKDMLVFKQQSPSDSFEIYRRATTTVTDVLAKSVTEEAVNRVSLAALTVLPRTLQNKFFYGSWIKKLLGLGEIDAAAAVVELQYQRNIKPDAGHLNGIIGAWLRSGRQESKEKAESLAWSMIHARIAFVDKRATESGITFTPLLRPKINALIAQKRPVPSATIETFSLLLQHYIRRSQMEAAEHLTEVMTTDAAIAPNSFIMNHWLYRALRKADIKGAWTRYVELSQHIRPDLETFACLWDLAKIQYDRGRAASWREFPPARKLFSQMHTWLGQLPSREERKAKDDFSTDLYDTIVRCFSLSHDIEGTLCVINALAETYSIYPTQTSANTILMQVSRVMPSTSDERVGRRRMRRTMRNQNAKLTEAAQLLQAVSENKNTELVGQGVDVTKLDDEESRKIHLSIMSEFLVGILRVVGPDVEDASHVVAAVEQASRDMGVGVPQAVLDMNV